MKALKILFADDDLKYSMLLKRFLEAEGYEVTVSYTHLTLPTKLEV